MKTQAELSKDFDPFQDDEDMKVISVRAVELKLLRNIAEYVDKLEPDPRGKLVPTGKPVLVEKEEYRRLIEILKTLGRSFKVPK